MPRTRGKNVLTIRCDFDSFMNFLAKNRQLIFFKLVMFGIFLITVGLLFFEKYIGNITEDLFWGYLFIVAGLMVLLKAATFMLFRFF